MTGIIVRKREWRSQRIQPARTYLRVPEGTRRGGTVYSALASTSLDTELGLGNARIRVGVASMALRMVLRRGAVNIFLQCEIPLISVAARTEGIQSWMELRGKFNNQSFGRPCPLSLL